MSPLQYIHDLLPPIPAVTVLTCLTWYLVSSITSQLSKVILVRFTYPLFLSSCQFFIGGSLSLVVIELSRTYPEFAARHFPRGFVPNFIDQSVPVVTTSKSSRYNTFSRGKLVQILPLGLFSFVGKLFSLNATSLISLATVSSIKALSPLLIVMGYRVFYGVKLPIVTLLSLAPLLLGVIVMILSEHATRAATKPPAAAAAEESATATTPPSPASLFYFDYNSIKGITFCVLSTITYASQNIYSKQLVTWDAVPTSNPASLVLSTEPDAKSGAGQPPPGGQAIPTIKTPPPSSPSDHNQNSIFNFSPGKMMRQRTGSIRLPYSTSDLRLDEKKEEVQQQQYAYGQTVQQNNQMVNNPFSALGQDRGAAGRAAAPETFEKPDKMTIVLYCSIIGFVFSFGGFVVGELPQIIAASTAAAAAAAAAAAEGDAPAIIDSTIDTTSGALSLMILVVLDTLSHFLQTLFSFHLLGSIPALSYSIASMMKRIVIITVSMVFVVGIEGTTGSGSWYSHITREQLLGLTLISVGLYSYDKWGSTALKRK